MQTKDSMKIESFFSDYQSFHLYDIKGEQT